MAILRNQTQDSMVIDSLQIAKSFKDRGIGLLGKKTLNENEGLWILYCNSIHTFFMNFAIDCVFVDTHLKVKAIRHQVKPWRWILPVWGATSVFELPAGTALRLKISIGDQLYVGS